MKDTTTVLVQQEKKAYTELKRQLSEAHAEFEELHAETESIMRRVSSILAFHLRRNDAIGQVFQSWKTGFVLRRAAVGPRCVLGSGYTAEAGVVDAVEADLNEKNNVRGMTSEGDLRSETAVDANLHSEKAVVDSHKLTAATLHEAVVDADRFVPTTHPDAIRDKPGARADVVQMSELDVALRSQSKEEPIKQVTSPMIALEDETATSSLKGESIGTTEVASNAAGGAVLATGGCATYDVKVAGDVALSAEGSKDDVANVAGVTDGETAMYSGGGAEDAVRARGDAAKGNKGSAEAQGIVAGNVVTDARGSAEDTDRAAASVAKAGGTNKEVASVGGKAAGAAVVASGESASDAAKIASDVAVEEGASPAAAAQIAGDAAGDAVIKPAGKSPSTDGQDVIGGPTDVVKPNVPIAQNEPETVDSLGQESTVGRMGIEVRSAGPITMDAVEIEGTVHTVETDATITGESKIVSPLSEFVKQHKVESSRSCDDNVDGGNAKVACPRLKPEESFGKRNRDFKANQAFENPSCTDGEFTMSRLERMAQDLNPDDDVTPMIEQKMKWIESQAAVVEKCYPEGREKEASLNLLTSSLTVIRVFFGGCPCSTPGGEEESTNRGDDSILL